MSERMMVKRVAKAINHWLDNEEQSVDAARAALGVVAGQAICGVCWTCSFQPCEETFDGAIPDGRGYFMFCDYCRMAKVYHEIRTRIVELERQLDNLRHNSDVMLNDCRRRAEALEAENARLRKEQDRLFHEKHEWVRRCDGLETGLGILTRACEAGAYVGRTSPAVIQARSLLQ